MSMKKERRNVYCKELQNPSKVRCRWYFVFERNHFCLQKLYVFDQKYSKKKQLEMLLQFKISFLFEYIFKCHVIPVTQSWIFSIIIIIIMSHDPSEISLICWLAAQRNSYYYQCWKQMCCLILWIESLEWIEWKNDQEVQKNSTRLKYKSLVTNVFTVTFDKFNTFLLNKNSNVLLILIHYFLTVV